MKRRYLTPKQKAEVRFRQRGRCKICGDPLPDSDRGVEYDHIQALVHGGSNDLDNFRAIHVHCHRTKTTEDQKSNAKVKRIRRKSVERARGITNAKQRRLAQIQRWRDAP